MLEFKKIHFLDACTVFKVPVPELMSTGKGLSPAWAKARYENRLRCVYVHSFEAICMKELDFNS